MKLQEILELIKKGGPVLNLAGKIERKGDVREIMKALQGNKDFVHVRLDKSISIDEIGAAFISSINLLHITPTPGYLEGGCKRNRAHAQKLVDYLIAPSEEALNAEMCGALPSISYCGSTKLEAAIDHFSGPARTRGVHLRALIAPELRQSHAEKLLAAEFKSSCKLVRPLDESIIVPIRKPERTYQKPKFSPDEIREQLMKKCRVTVEGKREIKPKSQNGNNI